MGILDDVVVIKNGENPSIIWRFNEKNCFNKESLDTSLPKDIEYICSPKEETSCDDGGREFFFVISDGRKRTMYGYCRQMIFPHEVNGRFDVGKKSLETVCLITSRPYYTLLAWIAKLFYAQRYLVPHLEKDIAARNFIDSLQVHDFKIGSVVSTASFFDGKNLSYHFHVPPLGDNFPLESYEEHIDIARVLMKLASPIVLIALVSAILCEQKIIVLSDEIHLRRAFCSCCIRMIQPFSWKYLLLSSLSINQLSFICAPIPYILGLHSTQLTQAQKIYPLKDIILFNLNENCFQLLNFHQKFPLLSSTCREITDKFSPKLAFDSFPYHPQLNSKTVLDTLELDMNAKYNQAKRTEKYYLLYFENSFLSLFRFLFGDVSSFIRSNQVDVRHLLESRKTREDIILINFINTFSQTETFKEYCLHRQQSYLIPWPERYCDRFYSSLDGSESSGHWKDMDKIVNLKEKLFHDTIKNVLDYSSNSDLMLSQQQDNLLAICHATYDMGKCEVIASCIWSRLLESKGKNWKHGHKALTLIQQLLNMQACEIFVVYLIDRYKVIECFLHYKSDSAGEMISRKIRLLAKEILEAIYQQKQLMTKRRISSIQNPFIPKVPPSMIFSFYEFHTSLQQSISFKLSEQPSKKNICDTLIDLDFNGEEQEKNLII